jgi:hypothetical protein
MARHACGSLTKPETAPTGNKSTHVLLGPQGRGGAPWLALVTWSPTAISHSSPCCVRPNHFPHRSEQRKKEREREHVVTGVGAAAETAGWARRRRRGTRAQSIAPGGDGVRGGLHPRWQYLPLRRGGSKASLLWRRRPPHVVVTRGEAYTGDGGPSLSSEHGAASGVPAPVASSASEGPTAAMAARPPRWLAMSRRMLLLSPAPAGTVGPRGCPTPRRTSATARGRNNEGEGEGEGEGEEESEGGAHLGPDWAR